MSKVKYFFSGTIGATAEVEEKLARGFTYRLCSCHDHYIKEAKRWAELCGLEGGSVKEIMLDSGAFTAWSKGKKVELQDLIATYQDVMKLIPSHIQIWLINLDVIPGSPGVTAGEEEITQAIKTSDENFKVLTKEFGNIVLPVFHQNESEARMFEVSDMADYICVSPRNDLPEKSRLAWSNYVHRKLPGKKTHGLAATGENMLRQVPWYSVDSASWLYAAVMGKIKFLHNGKLMEMATSNENPNRYEMGSHITTIPKHMVEVIAERAALHGLTIEQLQYEHMARRMMTGLEIVEWLKVLPEPNSLYQDSLFDL